MMIIDDIMVVIAVSLFAFILFKAISSTKHEYDEKWGRVHRSIWDVARKHEDD